MEIQLCDLLCCNTSPIYCFRVNRAKIDWIARKQWVSRPVRSWVVLPLSLQFYSPWSHNFCDLILLFFFLSSDSSFHICFSSYGFRGTSVYMCMKEWKKSVQVLKTASHSHCSCDLSDMQSSTFHRSHSFYSCSCPLSWTRMISDSNAVIPGLMGDMGQGVPQRCPGLEGVASECILTDTLPCSRILIQVRSYTGVSCISMW